MYTYGCFNIKLFMLQSFEWPSSTHENFYAIIKTFSVYVTYKLKTYIFIKVCLQMVVLKLRFVWGKINRSGTSQRHYC